MILKKYLTSFVMYLLTFLKTKTLADALICRDLVSVDGRLNPNDGTWQLRVLLGAIPTVDTCGVRYNPTTDKLEVSAIIRKGGIYDGKWCAIGGIIGKYKSWSESVYYHWQTDLGIKVKKFDWRHPYCVHQHRPPTIETGNKEEWFDEPNKHSCSPFYVVEPENDPKGYGLKEFGGQEAKGYTWFDKNNLPGPSEWAYSFWSHYHEVVNDENLLLRLKEEYHSNK